MGVSFSEFRNVSKKEWLEKVTNELKGKSFEDLMIHQTLDGLVIDPLYTKQDSIIFDWIKNYRSKVNVPSDIPGLAPRLWSNVALFGAQDSNQELLRTLLNGADALLLDLDGSENLNLLLKDVAPQYIQIFIKSRNPRTSLENFFKWVEEMGVDPLLINGGLLWDPLSDLFTTPKNKENIISQIQDVFALGEKFHSFKLLTIDAAVYHNTGAHIIQELSFALSSFIDLLDITSSFSNAHSVFDRIVLKTSVGADFFSEIAKLKAFRILTHRLAALYQVNISPESISVFAETSFWTKTTKDVHVNMIRNTTEAMVAILGGCNHLYTLPHDTAKGISNNFSKRMALNTSNILKEECYFDQVMDPVAGSYFIENLIGQIISLVQKKLLAIESCGGWLKMYESQEIQKEIKVTRQKRWADVERERKIIVGVNKYIFKGEDEEILVGNFQEEGYQLFPQRLTAIVENVKIKIS